MIAVPLKHRLARKQTLRISDLYGETMMMVKRGDSVLNDRLRDAPEHTHPRRIEDTSQFYDIDVFNQ